MANPDQPVVVRRHGVLRLFGTGVINQALLSAASFVVGLLLIRYTPDAEYGLYVLAQSALLFMLTAQGSFVDAPLMVLAAKKSPQEQARMLGAVNLSLRAFLRKVWMALALVIALAWAIDLLDLPHALVAAATWITGWTALRRDYLRMVPLLDHRPQVNLNADLVYIAVLVTAGTIATFWLPHAAAWAVLGAGAAGWVCAALLGRWIARHHPLIPGDAAPYWAEMRPLAVWASFGAMSYWLFAQGFNYVLAAKLDVEAVAIVNAVRLLLMPTVLLTVGVKGQLVPMASRWLRDGGLSPMVRKLGLLVLGLMALNLVYIGLLWVFRDWVAAQVLRKTIADYDTLLLLWAAVALVAMVRDIYQSGLLVRERFKPMAWLCVAGSLVSVAIIVLLADRIGPRAGVIALLCAESISLIGVLVLTALEKRRDRLDTIGGKA